MISHEAKDEREAQDKMPISVENAPVKKHADVGQKAALLQQSAPCQRYSMKEWWERSKAHAVVNEGKNAKKKGAKIVHVKFLSETTSKYNSLYNESILETAKESGWYLLKRRHCTKEGKEEVQFEIPGEVVHSSIPDYHIQDKRSGIRYKNANSAALDGKSMIALTLQGLTWLAGKSASKKYQSMSVISKTRRPHSRSTKAERELKNKQIEELHPLLKELYENKDQTKTESLKRKISEMKGRHKDDMEKLKMKRLKIENIPEKQNRDTILEAETTAADHVTDTSNHELHIDSGVELYDSNENEQ